MRLYTKVYYPGAKKKCWSWFAVMRVRMHTPVVVASQCDTWLYVNMSGCRKERRKRHATLVEVQSLYCTCAVPLSCGSRMR